MYNPVATRPPGPGPDRVASGSPSRSDGTSRLARPPDLTPLSGVRPITDSSRSFWGPRSGRTVERAPAGSPFDPAERPEPHVDPRNRPERPPTAPTATSDPDGIRLGVTAVPARRNIINCISSVSAPASRGRSLSPGRSSDGVRGELGVRVRSADRPDATIGTSAPAVERRGQPAPSK
jgi:hypothetical protein